MVDITKTCPQCKEEFSGPKWRVSKQTYCSKKCLGASKKAKPNTICDECGKEFHMKPSRKTRYRRSLGFFCSYACTAKNKTKSYLAENNPNNKNRNVNQDGYRIYNPPASHILGQKKTKLHKAVVCESLQVDSLPKNTHIHHRDCDVLNNTPKNLVLLSTSDHKWLHKQFGNATLWAYMRGKVSLEELSSWSDDSVKATELLELSVLDQNIEDFNDYI